MAVVFAVQVEMVYVEVFSIAADFASGFEVFSVVSSGWDVVVDFVHREPPGACPCAALASLEGSDGLEAVVHAEPLAVEWGSAPLAYLVRQLYGAPQAF